MEANQQPRKKSGAVKAFAFGATAAAAIALLTAPASGKITRKRIGSKLRKVGRAMGRNVVKAEKQAERKLSKLQRETRRNVRKTGKVASKQVVQARKWVTEHMPMNGHAANGKAKTARKPRRTRRVSRA